MLDSVFPWGSRVRAYKSSEILTRPAFERWELRGYQELRRAIFVEEQQLFDASDVDEADRLAVPIVALSLSAGMPDEVVGIVRIYPQAGGVWYGGRLGVRSDYRRHGVIGERLIKTAVGTAKGAGCNCFLATVQVQNARYFERHHFEFRESLEILGRPHVLMEAHLPDFEALDWLHEGSAQKGWLLDDSPEVGRARGEKAA
jgi:putative N-acetyltransferase (TIGR04045 family)